MLDIEEPGVPVSHQSRKFSMTPRCYCQIGRTLCAAMCVCRDFGMRVLRAIASCKHMYVYYDAREARRARSLLHGSSLLIKGRRYVDALGIFAHNSPYKQNLPMDNARAFVIFQKPTASLGPRSPFGPCGRVDGNFSVAPHRL